MTGKSAFKKFLKVDFYFPKYFPSRCIIFDPCGTKSEKFMLISFVVY